MLIISYTTTSQNVTSMLKTQPQGFQCVHACSAVCVKGTGNVIPAHAMKSYRGNGGTNALILTLGTRWQ
jgi:hypothetical protein